jgi:hypothetical protein
MKRLPETIALCFIISGLLTSGTTEKRHDDSSMIGNPIRQSQDTAGLTGLIKVDSFRLEIIPPSSGIQFYKNGIVFLSNTKYEGKMLAKHVSFGSIEAYTALVKDTSLGLHMIFSTTSSFPYPCEAITFSADFKTMYFTKIAKKEKMEKIYRAEFKSVENGNSAWVEDENALNFCGGNFRYTHPALSADGKMLIFSSDMTGSQGGMDLFIVRKEGEKWSKPENLGKLINTSHYECFPYLDQDNNLFFSSDGLTGFGGYDIFTCKYNGETWEKPVNLSHRINSENDDIAFSIDKTDGKSAFYTSRQKTPKGETQLFKVTLKQESVDSKPLTISYIYNGKFEAKTEMVALKPTEKPEMPAAKEAEKTVPAEVRKEVKVEEKKAAAPPTTAPSGAKVVIIKPTGTIPDELKDVVVYRIQFLSATKPRKESQIVIDGTAYKTYEYFYLDAYRYAVGEFTTLAPAKELQALCKKSGYPQAFIAAFKGNMRSLDLSSFK